MQPHILTKQRASHTPPHSVLSLVISGLLENDRLFFQCFTWIIFCLFPLWLNQRIESKDMYNQIFNRRLHYRKWQGRKSSHPQPWGGDVIPTASGRLVAAVTYVRDDHHGESRRRIKQCWKGQLSKDCWVIFYLWFRFSRRGDTLTSRYVNFLDITVDQRRKHHEFSSMVEGRTRWSFQRI